MNGQNISEEEAIVQVKKWYAEQDYEKAYLGCKEILEIDPNNSEIKEILTIAETKIKKTETTTPEINPSPNPLPETPPPIPNNIPEAAPTITPPPQTPAPTIINPPTEIPENTHKEEAFSLVDQNIPNLPQSAPMAPVNNSDISPKKILIIRIIAGIISLGLIIAFSYYAYTKYIIPPSNVNSPINTPVKQSISPRPAATMSPKSSYRPSPIVTPTSTPSTMPKETPISSEKPKIKVNF